ncbi:MAG: PilZ domain-containing protein [Terriglobales bacterium]
MAASVQFTLRHAPGAGGEEPVTVVNLSPHGAGVIAGSYWEPNERILVRAQGGKFVAVARVVYCHRQQATQGFAVGLELLRGPLEWPPRRRQGS